MSKGSTPNAPPAEGVARLWQSALQAALKSATANLGGVAVFIGAVATIFVAYYKFKSNLDLPDYWPEIICGLSFLLFFGLFFAPEFISKLKEQRLRQLGVHGKLVEPGYFRLVPYESDDAERFRRPDDIAQQLVRWIERRPALLLYLTGQSGAGKSSLISAALVPAMRARNWIPVVLRPHDAPLDQIRSALLRPGAIWANPPKADNDARSLVAQSAERARRDGKKLLIIIDQFEEALIICTEARKAEFAALLSAMIEQPVPGLTVMLSLRTEYLNDLPSLGLPYPAYGPSENAFDVRPFTRAEAESFVEASGLDLGPELLAKMLEEASEIEDMPDKMRPIVLNMFGLVVGSFSGKLPRGIHVGRLLSGYVERNIKSSSSPTLAVKILRALTTDAGTKRCLTTEQIGEQTSVDALAARGCLIALSNAGIVRHLTGKPERWEVAHDFVARLLQPILKNWRQAFMERARRSLAPVALAIWAFVAASAILFYPALYDEYLLSQLRSVGLVNRPPINGKFAFMQNGAEVTDTKRFFEFAALLARLRTPVGSLDMRGVKITSLQGMPALPGLVFLNLGGTKISSLQGMPALPALAKLDLSSSQITSLQGMPALPALATLDLNAADITSLQGMPAVPALATLDLNSSQITSLQGMPALPALATLDLSYTNITSLQGMPALPALATLELTGTQITSLQGMPALPALATLDLNAADITSLQDMPALPALARLNLFNAKITSLQGMPALPGLTTLDLSYTKIASLQGMPALPALATLDLRGAQITSLEGMPDLPKLSKIFVLQEQSKRLAAPKGVTVETRDY